MKSRDGCFGPLLCVQGVAVLELGNLVDVFGAVDIVEHFPSLGEALGHRVP
ncbi:MAG: hypothetical protein P4L43_10850 [Syntrophobacteraceae bacterium]|nr:hypothetical protein [Syntrophobacteraceae bacterium]